MFESPAIYPQDREQESSRYYAKAYFRRMESEEIQKLLDDKHPDPATPQFVERIRKKIYLKGLEEVEEFLGLVSQTVYNSKGEVIGDAFSEANAAAGGARVHSKPLREVAPASSPTSMTETVEEASPETRDGDAVQGDDLQSVIYYNVLRKGSNHKSVTVGRHIVAWYWGMELLERNTCKPEVWMDNPLTQQFVHNAHSQEVPTLSEEALEILMRSNYHAPFGLKYCHHDDMWSQSYKVRRRSLQVLTNILYICLERRDYARAWNALTCALRVNSVAVRLIWMPALELLAWRGSTYANSKVPEDFLNWLIANFPNLPQSRAYVHRARPRAQDFMPVSIMVKLSHGKFSQAMYQADQAVNSSQYVNNATCWALCGLATLKARKDDVKAAKCFKKCLDLGGVLPKQVLQHGLSLCKPETGEYETIKDALGDESSSDNSDDDDDDEGSIGESNNVTDETAGGSSRNNNNEANSHHDNYGEQSSDEMTADGGSENDTEDDTSDKDAGDDGEHASRGIPEVIMTSGQPESEFAAPSPKRAKLNTLDSSDSETFNSQPPSSQPFYSQATTLGGEMGSSDDSDYDF